MSEFALSSQTVFNGKLLHVKSDQVRLPNGHEATREYIVHPGAAMIIAMPAAWRSDTVSPIQT